MHRFILLFSVLLLTACPANQTTAPKASSPIPHVSCIIDDNSIGGIPLGATLNDVHQSYPQAIFTPIQDAEGNPLTAIRISPEIEIFADTERANAHNPITYLETASKTCKTEQGVFPGMSVQEAEKHYGTIEQIILNGMDARQTAEFSNQLPTHTFRIDDSGSFSEDDTDLPQITTEYQAQDEKKNR